MADETQIICNLITNTRSFPRFWDADYTTAIIELINIKNINNLKSSKNTYIQKGIEELKYNKSFIDILKEYNIDIKKLT